MEKEYDKDWDFEAWDGNELSEEEIADIHQHDIDVMEYVGPDLLEDINNAADEEVKKITEQEKAISDEDLFSQKYNIQLQETDWLPGEDQWQNTVIYKFKPFGRASRTGDTVILKCFVEKEPQQTGFEMTYPCNCVMVNPKKTTMEVIADYECPWFTAKVQTMSKFPNHYHVCEILEYELEFLKPIRPQP